MIECRFCTLKSGFWQTSLLDIGGYVKHLIKEHWDILQRLHDEEHEWV